MIRKTLKNKQGQAMSEYLILTLLIAVGAITMSQTVSKTIIGKLRDVHHGLESATLESVRGP